MIRPITARAGTERDGARAGSSHGTNPATATMAGFTTITVPSAADGGVDVDAFRAALGPRTAAVMITNPSTLGLFEARIGELLDAVHEAGALAYMDGANLNAILGRFKPGEAGFDVMHFNVHKTFSTPHGGGGPGAGPVGVGEKLLPYLPSPRVLREDDGTFRLERPDERPTSIGRLRSFVGNTGSSCARSLYPGARRVGSAGGQRRRRPGSQLPEVAARGHIRHPVRPSLQARVRGVGGDHQEADRSPDPRHRQATHRLRLSPADDLLPADRRGGDAHRADRDRIGRDPRCLRRSLIAIAREATRRRTSSPEPHTRPPSVAWTKPRRPANRTSAGAR
jgi:glycine dehydrogenase subunit 2